MGAIRDSRRRSEKRNRIMHVNLISRKKLSSFIADTHLLGSRQGHWFDKIRREWQMHRGFVTATQYLNPEVVFFLGDLFDEGKWSKEKEFKNTVERFHKLFPYGNNGKEKIVVVGNHEIGVLYENFVR